MKKLIPRKQGGGFMLFPKNMPYRNLFNPRVYKADQKGLEYVQDYNPINLRQNTRTLVEKNVNQTGVPRINPLYSEQYISPAVNKTGEAGYLRITPSGFGAYTEEFVPKSDRSYYNTVKDLYNKSTNETIK